MPHSHCLTDAQVFVLAAGRCCAILTESTADFVEEFRRAQTDDVTHYGVVFTSPRSFPRGSNTIGLFVQSLEALLSSHEAEDALINGSTWLTSA